MMQTLPDGTARFTDAPFACRFEVSWRAGGKWKRLPVRAEGGALVGGDGPVRVQITLKPEQARIGYTASFTSSYPTRIRLALILPESTSPPFHLIPGVMHGDNNVGPVAPGILPNLTDKHPEHNTSSTYWEFRADRGSHPLSAAIGDNWLAGMSVQLYSDGAEPVGGDHLTQRTFIRNGVFAQLAAGPEQPHACGVTIGYGNLPITLHCSKVFGPTTAHFSRGAEASGWIYLRAAPDRRAAHAIVRELWEANRSDRPRPSISREEAARDLLRAFMQVNWHGDDGRNAAGTSSGVASPFFGGKPFRNNFTNMRSNDEQKGTLVAWRTLPEVGWTGGATTAYPNLCAGVWLNDEVARKRALSKLDLVAGAVNPKSGLLFDVAGADEDEGKRLNWWWSAPPIMDCHCAYTNGSGVYYLLKSARLARSAKIAGANPDSWSLSAIGVLDAVMKLQSPEGNFGYTYHADRAAILDPDGFAGAWFIPGLAFAYEQTREKRYLDAATRALSYYHRFVRDLCCWGTPMDTFKAIDSEGIIGFLRGAIGLGHATKSKEFVGAATDAAHYEYLFRYGVRTRPQYKPLRDTPWNSMGGTMCTTGAGMMHPMGCYLAQVLSDLSEVGGDAYHAQRAEDGIDWGVNSVSMYPEHTGYGVRGVMTERWVTSDGMTLETHADGSPSSMWFSYNGWAAAAVLETLVEDHQRGGGGENR